MSTLAELIAEGRRIHATGEYAGEFFRVHGPRLLAVAEAAGEIADYAGHTGSFCGKVSCDCGYREARKAWDAAAGEVPR